MPFDTFIAAYDTMLPALTMTADSRRMRLRLEGYTCGLAEMRWRPRAPVGPGEYCDDSEEEEEEEDDDDDDITHHDASLENKDEPEPLNEDYNTYVQFIHQSMRGYIFSPDAINLFWHSEGNVQTLTAHSCTRLARTCIAYLGLYTRENYKSLLNPNTYNPPQYKDNFHDHAVRHWIGYFRRAECSYTPQSNQVAEVLQQLKFPNKHLLNK